MEILVVILMIVAVFFRKVFSDKYEGHLQESVELTKQERHAESTQHFVAGCAWWFVGVLLVVAWLLILYGAALTVPPR